MRRRGGEEPRTGRPDHERDRTCGTRQEDGVLDLVVAPRVADALAADEPADDLERLLEAGHAIVVRDPEGTKLGLVPARAHAEREATLRDLVDRRRHARDQPGRVEGQRGDERPEPHALGRCGERSERRPHVPRPALGAAVAAVEHVVADPDRVEAAAFSCQRDRAQLGPAHLALDLGQLDADTHAASRRRRR